MAPGWVPCPGLFIEPKGSTVGQGDDIGGPGGQKRSWGSREAYFNFGRKFKLPCLRKIISLKLGIKRSQKVTSYIVTTLQNFSIMHQLGPRTLSYFQHVLPRSVQKSAVLKKMKNFNVPN